MSRWIWPRALGALLALSVLSTGLWARAADDPSTTAAARERFKEGVSFFDQKQYEKARAAFLQAYALKKHPAVLLNLAQSELRSGHERDAAEHFTVFLREATEASSQEREAAESGLDAASEKVGEIRVTVDQPEAEVSVDGTSLGRSPLPDPVFVEPGSHEFEAKKAELTTKATVSAKAGDTKEVRLTLGRPAAPAPVAASELEEPAQEEPEPEPEESGSREPFLRWVTTRPAGIIPAGLTVLLGLGAGGFAIGSTIRYSDADSTAEAINTAAQDDQISTRGICNDPAARVAMSPIVDPEDRADRARQYQDACDEHTHFVDQGDTFKTVAIGLGIGAGVSAVTTVVLYFVTAPREGESSASSEVARSVAVRPWVTPSETGLSFVGRF